MPGERLVRDRVASVDMGEVGISRKNHKNLFSLQFFRGGDLPQKSSVYAPTELRRTRYRHLRTLRGTGFRGVWGKVVFKWIFLRQVKCLE